MVDVLDDEYALKLFAYSNKANLICTADHGLATANSRSKISIKEFAAFYLHSCSNWPAANRLFRFQKLFEVLILHNYCIYAYFLCGICHSVNNFPATSIASLQSVHVSAASLIPRKACINKAKHFSTWAYICQDVTS